MFVNVNIKMYKKGKITMYKKGNDLCTKRGMIFMLYYSLLWT